MHEPRSAFYQERAEDLALLACEAVPADVKHALLEAEKAFRRKAEQLAETEEASS